MVLPKEHKRNIVVGDYIIQAVIIYLTASRLTSS